MNNEWVINNLNNTFNTWNSKLADMWALLTTSPQEFKGGDIWRIIVGINGTLQAVGYALIVLFFAMSVFKSAATFRDFKRPEQALKLFIPFVVAKTCITYGMDILVGIFDICRGIVGRIAQSMGDISHAITLPTEIESAIASVGFFNSIGLWIVALIGSLAIIILSFIMILHCYGIFFKLYMMTAISPIPLSTFAGDVTSATGKAFIKSYIGVCMESSIIVLACIIFNAFANSGNLGVANTTDATAMIWSYLGEVIFNMLVLVGLVKGSDRIVKEMLAL